MFTFASKLRNMSLIHIDGMEFFAFHGCFAEEQLIGNKFRVDIKLKADTQFAQQTDDLSKTVNYQQVYHVVKREMAIKSKLLEHVGNRIITAIYREFPQVEHIELKISKLNPPLGGKIDAVAVTLER